MKNKNVFTYAAVAGVIIITIFALYQSTNAPDSDISDKDNQIIDTQDSYIWLTLEQAAQLAEQKGDMFRVVNIDGEAQIVTMDYRIGRINASTVDGIVTEFSIEGKE